MGMGMEGSTWRTCLGEEREEGLEEEEGTEGGGVGTLMGTDRRCTEYRTELGEREGRGSALLLIFRRQATQYKLFTNAFKSRGTTDYSFAFALAADFPSAWK